VRPHSGRGKRIVVVVVVNYNVATLVENPLSIGHVNFGKWKIYDSSSLPVGGGVYLGHAGRKGAIPPGPLISRKTQNRHGAIKIADAIAGP